MKYNNSLVMKYYLCVIPYENKEEVKAAGARWEKDVKMWYVMDEDNLILDKYDLTFLKCIYEDKDFIKSNGGHWNALTGSWYTYKSNTALQKFM